MLLINRPAENALHAFGSDRVLFSVDYPYEDNADAANWFDQLALPQALKEAIGSQNAAKLLHVTI